MNKTLAATLIVLSSACSSSLDVAATGEARVLMQRAAGVSPAVTPSEPQSTEQGARSVPEDTVESFMVTVVAIEVLQAGASDTSDNSAAWTSIALNSSFNLDLMALPTSNSAGRLVAQGEVRAGSYTRVRLRVTNPRSVFKGDMSFGAGGIVQGGAAYAVVIPSSQQTGIQVAVGVTVAADASSDIALVFDGAQSFTNLTLTGTGQVRMSPVIRARS